MRLFLKLLFGGIFVCMTTLTIRTGLSVSPRGRGRATPPTFGPSRALVYLVLVPVLRRMRSKVRQAPEVGAW